MDFTTGFQEAELMEDTEVKSQVCHDVLLYNHDDLVNDRSRGEV